MSSGAVLLSGAAWLTGCGVGPARLSSSVGHRDLNTLSHVHSFTPRVAESSRVLVLGTMPGQASLSARQYYDYAQPRNLFWTVIEHVLKTPASAEYERHVDLLLASDVALWDVVQLCTRESSLDSDIIDYVARSE